MATIGKWLILLWVSLWVLPSGPAASGPWPATGAYLPLVGQSFPAQPPRLQISALYYDTYQSGEPDEAFQLYNPTGQRVWLYGWQVSDGRRTAVFPAQLTLPPHGLAWCAREAASFALAFGFKPGCEYGADTDPEVPNLSGATPLFANNGGQIILLTPNGATWDRLVYEAGDTAGEGWQGPAVYPYKPSAGFGEAGQILYRKLDQRSGLPVPDTDTRADWAQDPDDLINGRKARYPGWELERFYVPRVVSEAATLAVFVSPDNAFATLSALLAATQHTIRFEGYTFENARLGELIAGRARNGVEVEIALDGAPPGGVTDQQRWIVQQIAEAGGRVYYFRSDPAAGIYERYRYQHGKFWLLDGNTALIGSENPNIGAFPDDDMTDGTYGRRGVYLVTDAPSVVAGLAAIMDADIAAGRPRDVWSWDPADPLLGAPPPGFNPTYTSGGIFYQVQKPHPLFVQGYFTFQLFHAPEQSLRDQDSLLGLIGRAGPGDTILVEQLYEHTYWGPESSDVARDPNPRLEAYINAARRGATVRVLLDAYFDNQNLNSPRSNLRTVEYLKAVAAAEGLDLDARRRNPTGEGIHNKMVLARIAGQGWVVVGSLNGGEVSAKLNREMNLIVASDEVYQYLAELFWFDWAVEP